MGCVSEFACSMYVDRELPAEEARQLEKHLAACDRCRALVEALRAESRMISAVLQAVETDAVPVTSEWRVGLRMALGFVSMVAVAAVSVTVVTWLARFLPSALEANLFSSTTWMNLFFSAALYVSNQGADIMTSIVSALSTLMLGLAVAGGFYLLARRSAPLALLAALALVFTAAQPASAIEARHGAHVSVPAGETVEGTLITAGETVTIDGTVNGDLVTGSKRVLIRGAVKGDVLAGSQVLDIEGSVGGNVYTFAQHFELHGTIAHNAYAWAQTVQTHAGAQVTDLTTGCGVSNLSGNVSRDLTLFCGSAGLRGNVGRDVEAYTGNLSLMPPARVGGNLTAHVDKPTEVQIDPGATVVGKTNIELHHPAPSRYSRPGFYFWQAVQLVAALLTGVVLFAIWPFLFATRPDTVLRTLGAAGIGFLVLIAAPIVLLIAGATLVGLPLAVMGLLTYLVGLYVAKLFVAALIGHAMVQPGGAGPAGAGAGSFISGKGVGPFALALLAGLVVLFIVMNLPYVGGLVKFVVILLGLGIASRQLYYRWRSASSAA